MSELSMTKSEREDFLAAPHIGVLAMERSDGPPLVTPIWYRYTAGGVVEFIVDGSSEKARLIVEAGHASLCVQREEYPYAYATVEGPVEIAGAADRATRLGLATWYLGSAMGTAYVDGLPEAHEIVVRLRPMRWRTIDYSKETLGSDG